MALSGFAMRRGYADTRLGQLHYATTGHGPALVLLPQAGRSWPMYAALAHALADDHQAIAIDYPGSGGSDPLPTDATIEGIAGSIVDVMDALSIKSANVFGVHTGNKIGAALAANHGSRVAKLVLAGQTHSIVPDNERRAQNLGKTRKKLLHDADAREKALVHWADIFNVVNSAWWREPLMRDLTNVALRTQSMVKAIDEIESADSMPAMYRANFAFDLQGAYARIAVPTLVLEIATPLEDRTIGRQGPALLDIIRGARLETIEAEDFHGITLEDHADVVAPILRRFLGAASTDIDKRRMA